MEIGGYYDQNATLRLRSGDVQLDGAGNNVSAWLGDVVTETTFYNKSIEMDVTVQELDVEKLRTSGNWPANGLIYSDVPVRLVTQLQIDTDIIRSVVLVLLAGVSLALALSFGLGTRDITRNLVAGFYARKLFRPGEKITIGEQTGTLLGISPLQVLVEIDDQMTTIPNSVFLDSAVRQ